MGKVTKFGLYGVVVIVTLLMGGDILFTHYNNQVILKNRNLQLEAETIKLYIEQIGKSTIHGFDIGLRGYALNQQPVFFSPVDSARLRMDSILYNVQYRLESQGYEMSGFFSLRDSLYGYATFIYHLRDLLDQDNGPEFRRQFAKDKGLHLWNQYTHFQQKVAAFEDRINEEAQKAYNAALARDYAIQITIFVIGVPLLFLAAFQTTRSLLLADKLKQTQEEKYKILAEQKEELERMVSERTMEIAAQNEEIVSQNELLVQQREEIESQRDTLLSQNDELQEAKSTIEKKNAEIHKKNESLREDVQKATLELKQTNHELIEQNLQLEQFAFVAAHGLRGPIARILGLANLIKMNLIEADREYAFEKLVASTKEMDVAIHDLARILEVRKHKEEIVRVDVASTIQRALRTLEGEILESGAVVETDLKLHFIDAVPSYLENILYNLVSNSIKYRDPARIPSVKIASNMTDRSPVLSVSDNGLGLDLARHRKDMFSLYKRFHVHMEGKGLGLYLIRLQTEAMGGIVDVESNTGKGSTFYIRFATIQKPTI